MKSITNKAWLLTMCIGLALLACKKDVIEEPIPENEECGTDVVVPPNPPFANVLAYFPMSIGSYWIYDWTTIDTLGNETSYNQYDTVVGDTVINGNIYVIFEGDYFSFPQQRSYYRDSLNFIVDSDGTRILSDVATIDTLDIDSFPGYSLNYMLTEASPSSVVVPSGTFTSLLSKRKDIWVNDPNYEWGHPRSAGYHYAAGVGNVENFAFFISSPNILRRRLTDYYIAP